MKAQAEQAVTATAPPEVEAMRRMDLTIPAMLERFREGVRRLVTLADVGQKAVCLSLLDSQWADIAELQEKLPWNFGEATKEAVAAVWEVRGLLSAVAGHDEEALDRLTKALDRCEGNGRRAATTHILGTLRRAMGNPEAGLSLHQHALGLVADEWAGMRAQYRDDVADALLALGRVREAASQYAEAVSEWKRAARHQGELPLAAVEALDGFAVCLHRLGRVESEIRVSRRALLLRAASLPSGDVELVFRSIDLKHLLRREGIMRRHHLGLWLILAMSANDPQWLRREYGSLLGENRRGERDGMVLRSLQSARSYFEAGAIDPAMGCFSEALAVLRDASPDHPYSEFVARYYARHLREAEQFALADQQIARQELVALMLDALRRARLVMGATR